MTSAAPILVGRLLGEVCERLHILLQSLQPDDWHRPTSSSERLVRDVASHLLDGSLRRLSLQRDNYVPPAIPGEGPPDEPLLSFLHRLNREWDRATRRLSPLVLIGLLEWADPRFVQLMNAKDPFGPALFPVAWAGEDASRDWFDVAREYTEKWHHTQQIFEAVGQPSTIVTREFYHPCLETFLRALPFSLTNVNLPVGTTVTVEILGEAGDRWRFERIDAGWRRTENSTAPTTATLIIPQEVAWQVFTKRRPARQKLEQFPSIRLNGDPELGMRVLEVVAVMA